MGMTMAEKILAKNSGLSEVKPGQYVTARIDKVLVHPSAADISKVFKEIGIKKVYDPSRVVAVTGSWIPARDIESAESDVATRKFV